MMSMTRLAPLIGLIASGCKSVDPAPNDLDALLRFFFSEYDSASDETMAEAFRNLDEVIGGADLEHSDGTVSRLSTEEISTTSLDHADPALAVGLYMVNPVACTLDQMVELITATNQSELYPGTYETFTRTPTSDLDAFRAGETDLATWDEDFSVSMLGISYSAENLGGVRRIAQLDAEQSPWGATLLTRRYMTGPADMADEDHSYPQDWRAEIYYERAPGSIVHAAAMWREADFGSVLNSESEGTQRLLLNGLQDWDGDSDAHCETMR